MDARHIPIDRGFESTRWSVVIAAGADVDDTQRNRALSELCEVYWPPLYAFARRKGKSKEDAQDLTQSFFVQLLHRRSIGKADQTRGRFRSFLLASFNNFIADARNKDQTQKRGGKLTSLPLDFAAVEESYARMRASLTPEELFDRRWVLTLLARIIDQLSEEYRAKGKSEQFACLKGFLGGKSKGRSYREAASELGLSEAAAMSLVSRMRRRYRELLIAEISHTVADPAEIDDEIKTLFRCLT